MFKTIVLLTLLGSPQSQIMDERGPYSSQLECYARGHEIVKFLYTSAPMMVIGAETVCIEVPLHIEKPQPETPKTPKKQGPTVYQGPTERL